MIPQSPSRKCHHRPRLAIASLFLLLCQNAFPLGRAFVINNNSPSSSSSFITRTSTPIQTKMILPPKQKQHQNIIPSLTTSPLQQHHHQRHRHPLTTLPATTTEPPPSSSSSSETTTTPSPLLPKHPPFRRLLPLLATLLLTLSILFSTFIPTAALAVQSGGRMGGSFSPSSRSSSSPPPSRSYGGASSRGVYRPYSSPSVIVTPGPSYYGGPFYNPFWGGPRYYPGTAGVVVSQRGPSFFDIAFFGVVAFVIFNSVASSSSSGGSSSLSEGATALGAGTSVVQLSVALDVPRRDSRDSILATLKGLSRTARTDSRVGVQALVSQVALELLRRKGSIFAASAKYEYCKENKKAQRRYNEWAVRERSKFERETVSRFGGVDYSTGSSTPYNSDNEYGQATVAVITILLTIDGDSTKIPTTMTSMRDVETALATIAADAKVDDCLQSAEILWAPEDRTEVLSRRDIIADYPDLRTL